MDSVRVNLYLSLCRDLLRRPPKAAVLKNYVAYRWAFLRKATRISHYPLSLVFYTNKLCNFSCSFCYNQEVLNKPDSKRYNLGSSEFRRIMESPFGKHALRIAFLGGEPFLNPEIFDFLEYCARERKISNVVTNASKLKGEALEKLANSPINVVGISLYENNRPDVERVVRRLNDARRPYWVQTVCSATDIPGIGDQVRFCRGIGCKNMILSNYNPSFDQQFAKVIHAGNPDYDSLERELKKEVSGAMNVQWVNPVRSSARRVKSCRLPTSYMHIDNQGDIGACCFRYPDRKAWGNIFDAESWNAPDLVELRKNLYDDDAPPLGECKNCENLSRDLYSV